jgi:hypothetical protein
LHIPVATSVVVTSGDSRILVVDTYTLRFESDFLICDLAKHLGLHQCFGTIPSVEMLL